MDLLRALKFGATFHHKDFPIQNDHSWPLASRWSIQFPWSPGERILRWMLDSYVATVCYKDTVDGPGGKHAASVDRLIGGKRGKHPNVYRVSTIPIQGGAEVLHIS